MKTVNSTFAFPCIRMVFVFFCFGMISNAQSDAPPPAANNEPVFELEKLVISAGINPWFYAKTDYFEVLSGMDSDKRAASIIRQAETLIRILAGNNRLFRLNQELPVKVIMIQDRFIERFISSIDEKKGAEVKRDAVMTIAAVERPGIQGLKRNIYNPSESATVLAGRSAEQTVFVLCIPRGVLYDHEIDDYDAVSRLVGAYLYACITSHRIRKTTLSYVFSSIKILSLDSSERGLIRRPSPEIHGPKTIWFKMDNNGGVLLRRYDRQLEFDIFKAASDNFPEARYGATIRRIDSIFLKAPDLDFEDVIERPEKFHVDLGGRHDMRAVENNIKYKRMITDFSYYCAFGPDENVRKGYLELLRYAGKQPVSESAFVQCFGKNYRDFHREMYAYFRKIKTIDNLSGKWGASELRRTMPSGQKRPKTPRFNEAARGESVRMISDWFLVNKAPDMAGSPLLNASRNNPGTLQNPDFIAAFGLYQAQHGDSADALGLLEQAVALKVERPAVYRALSILRLKKISSEKGKNHQLSAGEIDHVLEPLLAILKHPCLHTTTYMQIAAVWRSVNIKTPASHLALLTDACREHLNDIPLLEAVVPLLRKNGLDTDAAALLGLAGQQVLSDKEKQRLDRLRIPKQAE